MKFTQAKRILYKECKEQLIELGFFESYDCWYKIDFKSNSMIFFNCRRYRSGRELGVGFSVITLMHNFCLTTNEIKTGKTAPTTFKQRHFEDAFAENYNDYIMPQRSDDLLPMDGQLAAALYYINKIALPQFSKIKTMHDVYEFYIQIKNKTKILNIEDNLYPLSTFFADWQTALSMLSNIEFENDNWGKIINERLSEEVICDEMRMIEAQEMYNQKKIELETDKENILYSNSLYFQEKWNINIQNNIQKIKNVFKEEIKKGQIILP